MGKPSRNTTFTEPRRIDGKLHIYEATSRFNDRDRFARARRPGLLSGDGRGRLEIHSHLCPQDGSRTYPGSEVEVLIPTNHQAAGEPPPRPQQFPRDRGDESSAAFLRRRSQNPHGLSRECPTDAHQVDLSGRSTEGVVLPYRQLIPRTVDPISVVDRRIRLKTVGLRHSRP